MEISLTFMGYGHTKLPIKVDSSSPFNVTVAVKYKVKVTEGSGFITQEILNFQKIDCLVQDDDNFITSSKIQLTYFPRTSKN